MVRTADTDVEDQPVIPAAADAGIADAVELPGAGDGEVLGADGMFGSVDSQAKLATLKKADLNALVAVPVEAPVLVLDGVPIADCLEAGKAVFVEAMAGIVASGESFELELTGLGGLEEGLAGIGVEGAVVVAVDGNGSGQCSKFFGRMKLDELKGIAVISCRQ